MVPAHENGCYNGLVKSFDHICVQVQARARAKAKGMFALVKHFADLRDSQMFQASFNPLV